MNPQEWLGVLGILLIVVALFGGLRLYQLVAKPAPEHVRKLFHACGGLFGLPLPWIFDSLIPVLLLGVLITAAFITMRFVGRLRCGVGQVLFAVKRESIGELCYIASMVLLFWLSRGDKLLYTVPLLMLALADTAAALVGEEYGKLQIRASGGPKSIEGAIAFFFHGVLLRTCSGAALGRDRACGEPADRSKSKHHGNAGRSRRLVGTG